MSADTYFLDFETYSPTDLKRCGAFKYASDPAAEILLCAVALNDSEPLLWDGFQPQGDNAPALALLRQAVETGAKILAHNAPFEIAVSKYLWERTFGFAPPALEQWRCTAALCRRMAIPFSLDGAADFLKVPHQKNKEGALLIKRFCVGLTPGTPHQEGTFTLLGEKITWAEGWRKFREYCLQDVRVERDIHKALGGGDLEPFALQGFQFDLQMNDRGIPVNLDALHKAQKIVVEYQERLRVEFKAITGFSPSQTGVTLKWLRERGYKGEDLKAQTMDDELEEDEAVDATGLPADARRALEIRSLVSYAAVKKLKAMIDCACSDSRIRGSLMWSGALRTHRWSGRLIQPQNFKRPTIKYTESAYADIIAGCGIDDLELAYGPVLETVSSCIRHFIHDPARRMLDADYASIEARITPYLCGQTDMLDAFREGRDLYVEMATVIYNKPAKQISKPERWVAKQAVLACCFSVAAEKFHLMCQMNGRDIPMSVAEKAVAVYRKQNQKIVSAWKRLTSLVVSAIEEPERKFFFRKDIWFAVTRKKPFHRLVACLPSGHKLIYPLPETRKVPRKYRDKESGEVREWEANEISYYGPVPGKMMWGRTLTHGGKLLENLVQSFAGDVMSFGALEAERRGFEINMLVHDQALCPYYPERGQSPEKFRQALTTLPPWCQDFPLDATAGEVEFYTKD